MKLSTLLSAAFALSISAVVPATAVTLGPGQSASTPFTLTGDQDPPYSKVFWNSRFATDGLSASERLQLDVFDGNGLLVFTLSITDSLFGFSIQSDIQPFQTRSGVAVLTAVGDTRVDFIPAPLPNRRGFELFFDNPVKGLGAETGELAGQLTLVAPVPLPTAAWMLLGGVGALGFAARKARRQDDAG